jgi:hypothetical protein
MMTFALGTGAVKEHYQCPALQNAGFRAMKNYSQIYCRKPAH